MDETEPCVKKKLRNLLPKPTGQQPTQIEKYLMKSSNNTIKSPRKYDCSECGQKWNSYRQLKDHQEVHNCINICNFCNSMMANEVAVETHKQQKHEDGKYQCQICEMRYTSKKHFRKHIQTVHKVNNYFICTLCIQPNQCVFYSKTEILQHFETAHTQELDDELHMNEEFLDEFLLSHDAEEENSIQFSECWADLDLHLHDMLRIKTNSSNTAAYKCPICFEDFTTQKNLLIHMGHIHDRNVLICNKCEAAFNRRHDLVKHKMMHRLKDDASQGHSLRLQCKICDKDFRTSSGLNYHIKTHTGLKPHNCPYCQKQFQANTNLKKHLRIVHSNIKRHICSLCDKQFATKDHLKKHLTIHDNERKHLCNVCGKRFIQLCHLKQHSIIHSKHAR